METTILQDQLQDQELDGRMWFRGMHYDKKRRRGANRDEWRRLMRKAKARKEL
jgi:hypothetical protein